METTAPVIDAKGIAKSYGRQRVLREVSFQARRGELIGIVGENGSGKTTLLKVLVGLFKPDAGVIAVSGRIGYCPQESLVFGRLTVEENIRYFARAYGLGDNSGAERLLEDLQFDRYRRKLVGKLSSGTRQKLNLTIALMHDPDILILDEPYNGFDWETYLRFWEMSEALQRRGKCIVVVSHFVYDHARFDRIYALKEGVLRCEVVDYTTGPLPIFFKLKSISDTAFIQAPARDVSLVFIGLAAAGLLTSFLGMNLVQKDAAVNRRLILCGYRASEVILSKLGVLIGFILVIGAYVASLVYFFFDPQRWISLAAGFMLGGFVYGCYGLLVGAVFRRELEGILFIILLANIDAGWLQNPVFYLAAENTELIEWMPAYYPSQISLTAAFTEHEIQRPVLWSLAYGALLLIAGVGAFAWRMRGRGDGDGVTGRWGADGVHHM